MGYEVKQVIVMRKDLNMRKGKMIAQGSHASMAFITRAINWGSLVSFSGGIVHLLVVIKEVAIKWMRESFAKVVLSVDSKQELDEIYNKAKEAGLEVHLVEDNGATEFHGVKTKTCIAIGPDYSNKIDLITGHLKLL